MCLLTNKLRLAVNGKYETENSGTFKQAPDENERSRGVALYPLLIVQS